MDYKTKWEWYDLRISIAGDQQMWDLVDGICEHYYQEGYREDLANRIREIDPNTKYTKGHTINMLKEELDKLENNEEYGRTT